MSGAKRGRQVMPEHEERTISVPSGMPLAEKLLLVCKMAREDGCSDDQCVAIPIEQVEELARAALAKARAG